MANKTVTPAADPKNQETIDALEKSVKTGETGNDEYAVRLSKPREVVDLGNGTSVEHF